MGLAQRLHELIDSLPEDKAAEVLNFAEYVKTSGAIITRASRKMDFSLFDQVKTTYDGKLNREELYDRDCLH